MASDSSEPAVRAEKKMKHKLSSLLPVSGCVTATESAAGVRRRERPGFFLEVSKVSDNGMTKSC